MILSANPARKSRQTGSPEGLSDRFLSRVNLHQWDVLGRVSMGCALTSPDLALDEGDRRKVGVSAVIAQRESTPARAVSDLDLEVTLVKCWLS